MFHFPNHLSTVWNFQTRSSYYDVVVNMFRLVVMPFSFAACCFESSTCKVPDCRFLFLIIYCCDTNCFRSIVILTDSSLSFIHVKNQTLDSDIEG
ncbi:hypothetical protein OUZ56_014099 [Daphnia magna]|uniref:Uncharacterized protein n=1 Tax=Daphnia magna TaxID=35525 RepID=A0ABQ9Z7Y0_9CRUS|nr:hypothetical protein OUZ56_014099 [Daphnia magna]